MGHQIPTIFRVEGINKRFQRQGEMLAIPPVGTRVDVGEGYFRGVSEVYYSTADGTQIVWLEDEPLDIGGRQVVSPTDPRDDLAAFGWQVVP